MCIQQLNSETPLSEKHTQHPKYFNPNQHYSGIWPVPLTGHTCADFWTAGFTGGLQVTVYMYYFCCSKVIRKRLKLLEVTWFTTFVLLICARNRGIPTQNEDDKSFFLLTLSNCSLLPPLSPLTPGNNCLHRSWIRSQEASHRASFPHFPSIRQDSEAVK
jgi:hypothetical protein